MKPRTWAKLTGFLLCACVFALIALKLTNEAMHAFDLSVTQMIVTWRTPALTAFLRGVTTLCAPVTLLGICLVLMFLYRKKHFSIPIAVNLMVSVSLNYTLKNVFLRERPSLAYRAIAESGYSFPSGHAMAAGRFTVF